MTSKLGKQHTLSTVPSCYSVLCFDDLYVDDPAICPTYYFYIVSMYNPANVGSSDFLEQAYHSKIIRNLQISEDDKKLYDKIRRESPRSNPRDPSGKPKPEGYRKLEEIGASTSKKAKRAFRDKHPSYLNDIRSLSLILYYALKYKENVVYYTADGDPVTLFLTWLDSVAMRMTLNTLVLKELGRREKALLKDNRKVEFRFDYEVFQKMKIGLFKDLCADKPNSTGLHFRIRLWERKRGRYGEGITFVFSAKLADYLSNFPGSLWCHFTENASYGNWLDLHYFWPPSEPNDSRIRVQVSKKRSVNPSSIVVPADAHNRDCSLRLQDHNGQIATWSQFA